MNKGFTLIELLVVVTILGFMAMATVPIAEMSYIREKETQYQEALSKIRTAIRRWRQDCQDQIRRQHGLIDIPESLFFPPDIGALVKGPPSTYSFDWQGKMYIFRPTVQYLEAIPLDPFAGAPIWVQYYASGTANASSVYEVGNIITDASISTASGVFDVSCHYDPARRRGFEIAVDGSKYIDW